MSHSGVNLYAEFLLNISQVTIFATLDLKGGDDETAHLSSDRQRIEITYGGESAAITYPNGISGTAIVHLPIKAAAHVSLRLEITEKGDPYWKNSLETLNDSPWTAHAFSSDTTVACRWCKAVVCDPSRIQRWKDLPRSDWAETMDMWHCHKPEVPGESHAHDGHKHPDKNGFVQLRQGTAFIDSSDLVVVPTDTDLQPVSLRLYPMKQDRKKVSWSELLPRWHEIDTNVQDQYLGAFTSLKPTLAWSAPGLMG